jgi:cytochrome c-type biogenesis protein CcmH
MEPEAPEPSYRTRNAVLAVAALVMMIAAVVRLAETAKEVPPEQTPRVAAPAPAPVPIASALRIAVHVSLGAGVELPPATTVFLVVRESGGSRMPLAVRRLTVAELPADFVLTDADAMMPGRTLSAATTVEVIARASRSGDVKAVPGDFEARSGALPTATIHAETPIQLVIADPV